jgi:lysophospholipase L1-like esterase
MYTKLAALVRFSLICVLVVAGAELGARADDWTFEGVPFWSAPSESALWTNTNGVRHGRPHAQFRKKIFNNLGFEGPDVHGRTPPGCVRVLFLGGSETFGVPQIAGGHFPEHTRVLLSGKRCVEVLNGAIPGMTVASMIEYWREHARRARPDIVFIYPSTHFYLSEEAPRPAPAGTPRTTAGASQEHSLTLTDSRFVGRLVDAIELPQFIQVRRQRAWLEAQLVGKPADWLFETPPQDRVRLFVSHVEELVREVRASGARVVLATHAVRVAPVPRPEDQEDLFAMRTFTPRATERALAAFPYLANEALRAYATRESLPLVDASKSLGSQRENFVDLVHFSPVGTERMAKLVAAELEQQMPSQVVTHAVQ